MLLFENEFYRLHHYQVESEYCVVTFDSFDGVGREKDNFFFREPAKKIGIEVLGVVAKTNCWYRREEFDQILLILKEKIPKHKKILLFGASMGGYAAIKYSRILNADYVLALAPQFTLDYSERGYSSFYDQFYQDYMRGMAIRKTDIQGKIYILYDPSKEHEDKENFELIKKELKDVTGIKIFYSGHVIMETIKGSENFSIILNSLNNENHLIKNLYKIRRQNKNNISNILLKSSYKHPLLTYNGLLSKKSISTKSTFFLMRNRQVRKELSMYFVDKKEEYKFIDIIKNFYIKSSNVYFSERKRQCEFFLFSYFGDMVGFSVEQNKFVNYENDNNAYPIIFDQQYNKLFYQDLNGKALLEIKLNLIMDNNFCSVKVKDKYLSCLPDGLIVCDRDGIQGWEKFLLIPL